VAGRTDNTVVIAAPMDLIWDMTNDVESWPDLFGEYASAEILSKDGDTVRFRLTTRPDEEGRVASWVSERTANRRTRTVHAERIETGPLVEYMTITWSYEQRDDGVALRWIQEFKTRATAPVNDAEAEAYLNKHTAQEMARIKEKVEQAASG
jgi:aromatase